MKILALDQSTKLTGYALFQNKKLKKHGVLDSDVKENLPLDRMRNMHFLLKDLIKQIKPDYVILEAVQYQKNLSTYGQLSQLQGVIFSLLFELDLGFHIIESSAWKSFNGVKGRARKEQKASAIQKVKNTYNIEVSSDIADAILIGLWGVKHIES